VRDWLRGLLRVPSRIRFALCGGFGVHVRVLIDGSRQVAPRMRPWPLATAFMVSSDPHRRISPRRIRVSAVMLHSIGLGAGFD
jgi:hypothetical protein